MSDGPERLERLMAISEALMTARERATVVELILESGAEVFDAEGCSLALVDGDELSFVAMAGAAKTQPFRIPKSRGIAGAVATSGEPVIVRDTSEDPRFLTSVDSDTGFQTRSVMCVPIRRREQIVGVMQALNGRRAGGFDDDDVALLSAFASLAGAALDRAESDARRDVHDEVLQAAAAERYHLVGTKSPHMREVLRTLRTAAKSTATVLLLGESGTGKEILARNLHRQSPRRQRPFVAVNCTALTPTLLESELFGHEKGAFTGATGTKKGKFELADGGTLFLDEIGDLAPELQTKLLRALQEREVERVGGEETRRVDVRVVAATNRDLHTAMRDGSFREDLYYRLAVVTLNIPPLRERGVDVPDLATHFLMRTCKEVKRPALRFSEDAARALRDYHWPGNVRELANVVERAVVLSSSQVITLQDLPSEVASGSGSAQTAGARPVAQVGPKPLSTMVADFKRDVIREALRKAEGNQTRAAELLEVHQSNLSRMMKTLGLR